MSCYIRYREEDHGSGGVDLYEGVGRLTGDMTVNSLYL